MSENGGQSKLPGPPNRIRYRQDATLEVTLRNASDVTLDSVRVSMDTAYLGAFYNTEFTAQLDDRHAVVLRDIVPGESRLLKGQLKAERYWNHLDSYASRPRLPTNRSSSACAL